MIFHILKHLWHRLGRFLIPLRLRLAYIVYKNPEFDQGITKLDSWTVLKSVNWAVQRQEAAGLTFVRQHTTIPIPTLLDKWDVPGSCSYIRMSLCPGVRLDTAWSKMTNSARKRTAKELRGYIAQLRALKHRGPGEWVGSVERGPVTSARIGNGFPKGPWESGRAFHAYLLEPLKTYPPDNKNIRAFKEALSSYSHRIVFSHADLSFENILVDPKTGMVTAIVDWATAGWWPAYWEYRMALYGTRTKHRWWINLVRDVMEPHEDEFWMDADLEWF